MPKKRLKAMPTPQRSDATLHLRELANRLRKRREPELRIIQLPDFEDEIPTRVGPMPSEPPRSLGRRAVDRTAHELGKVSRPVQILAGITALIAALTPLLLELFKVLAK
jgi:hypothetical protein